MSDAKYWVHSDILQRNVSDYEFQYFPDMLEVTIFVANRPAGSMKAQYVTTVYHRIESMQLRDAQRIFLRLSASIDRQKNTFAKLDELGFELVKQTVR